MAAAVEEEVKNKDGPRSIVVASSSNSAAAALDLPFIFAWFCYARSLASRPSLYCRPLPLVVVRYAHTLLQDDKPTKSSCSFLLLLYNT